MSRNIISSIDIRADKVICIIAQELQIINKGKIIQLIGIGTSKFPIECIKPFSLPKKDILDNIRAALNKAETDAGVKVSEVFLSISENISSEYIEFDTSCNNSIVKEYHIKEFFKSKEFKKFYSDSREPLHSFPISYRLDDKRSVSDPIGLFAKKLIIKWHIIRTSKEYLDKIYSLFNNLDLNLKQIVFSNYSTSLAVLNEEEADLGAVTIDIQKNKTVLSYTFDGKLIGFDTIKIGIFHFVNDISQIKSISLTASDQIRKQIDIFDRKKNNDKKIKKLYDIYFSRAEELAKIIKITLTKSKFYSLVSSNVILTGYGAKSIIIQNLIRNFIRDANFRVGSTRKINGSRTYLDNPSLTSAFGILTYAANHDLEGEEMNRKNEKKSIISIIYKFFKNL